MLRKFLLSVSLAAAFGSGAVAAESAAGADARAVATKAAAGRDDTKSKAAKPEDEAKALSGMSILGNQEAPKALVIVPWKSSQIGDSLGIDKSLDDSRGPVDKDVFMRELAYYEIRSNSK
jgi:hypothetical protein